MPTHLPIHTVQGGRDHPKPSTDVETPRGHTYELAELLRAWKPNGVGRFGTGSDAPHEPFPDEVYCIPIPNQSFQDVKGLSGVATRLLFLLSGVAYSYDEGEKTWTTSPRHWTRENLRNAFGSVSLSGSSFQRAARELEERGVVDRSAVGQATGLRLLRGHSDGHVCLPYPLLRVLSRLSHAAVKVLFCTVRETWGQVRTEWRDGKEVLVHQSRAQLTNDDLSRFTGLSVRACQSAAHELRAKGVAHRSRPHQGSAYFYELTLSQIVDKSREVAKQFFNTSPPTSSNTFGRNYTGPHDPSNDSENGREVEGTRFARGYDGSHQGGVWEVDDPQEQETVEEVVQRFDEEEKAHFEVLTGGGFDLDPAFVARRIAMLSGSVLARTMRVFQQKRRDGDIESPSGWMYLALKEVWFSRKQYDPDPYNANDQLAVDNERRRRDSQGPAGLAAFMQQLVGQPAGWEDLDGGTASGGHEESGHGPQSGENPVGFLHSRMAEISSTLKPGRRELPGEWQFINHEGGPNRFVPNRRLARYCYATKDNGGEKYQDAAGSVLNVWAEISDWNPE